jgi:2-phosphoglycerate kinase
MKTIVINDKDATRVPFLRGILIRSLLDAGLEFEDALELATGMRDQLNEVDQISSDEIRQRVSVMLEENGHLGAMEPYSLPLGAVARILVDGSDDSTSAFSRAGHERNLQGSGLKAEKAEQVTNLIYEHLLASGADSIHSNHLAYLTYLCLEQENSKKAAQRYLVWTEYLRSGRPLLLMICGTVGSGKSTVATDVAHLLDIVRIQSTDMLREVMRMMMPKQLLPVLHSSSFDAWQALPIQDVKDRDMDQVVQDGFRSQAELLSVSVEAVLNRAIEERVAMIIEGVHVHPSASALPPEVSDAIIVQATLAVLKAKVLKARLRGRGAEVPKRLAQRYMERFDAIWSLQSFLLSESDQFDVPIITNNDRDKTVRQIIQHVNYELSRHFNGKPRDVFGDVVDRVGDEAANREWYELVPMLVNQ